MKAGVTLKPWVIRGFFKELALLLAALPIKTQLCLTFLDNPAAKVIVVGGIVPSKLTFYWLRLQACPASGSTATAKIRQ